MKYLAFFAFTFVLVGLQSRHGHTQERPPNIIIIFTDDLGYGDLGVYGHPTIRTPKIDRMAEEGIKFSQFYVAASVCTPSRAGLLTGRYPIRTGLVQGIIPGRVLFPNSKTGLSQREVTIAEVLKERGYATMAVGKWHLGHLPEFLPTSQGFDGYFGIPYSNDMDHVGARDGQPAHWNVPLMRDTEIVERPADQSTLTKRYTEESIRFIREHTDGPFFLYLAHTMPHIPLFASDDFTGISARGLYGDVVEEIDWSVGEILATLTDLGIDENTLVIFTSDNGPWLVQKEDGGSAGLLKEGKGSTWEGGMRVPMITWWPGRAESGMVSQEIITSLDLLPTIASLAGAEIPDRVIDGMELVPALTGKGHSKREFFAFYRGDILFSARYGPWKAHFITQTAYPDGPMITHNPPLLYHLENDPSERFDLAKDQPEVITRIQELVAKHEESVDRVRRPTIEGENLVDQAVVTGGRLRVQQMENFSGSWSGNAQLWWVEAGPGDRLSFPMEVEEAGQYEIIGYFTRAGDYGIVRLSVNGEPVGALMDGFAHGVVPTGAVVFGTTPLHKGENTVSLEIVGKDVRSGGYSNGYLVGIDGFQIR